MPDDQTKGQPRIGALTDPYRNYNFLLRIQGIAEARFTECRGLAVHVEPIRYRESGAGQVVRAMTGQLTYANLTLCYGLTSSLDLWNWMMASARGTVSRLQASVVMLDSSGTAEGMRWDLTNAWPCAWRGAPLDAMGRTVAIEEMELAYDTLERR